MKAMLTLIFFMTFVLLVIQTSKTRSAVEMMNLSNEAHVKCIENDMRLRQQIRGWREMALEGFADGDQ